MAAAGVICEFDPFHRGHAGLLRRLRGRLGAGTAVVCVMSGNYVQRGAPALFDKLTRARAAVDCGVSLALELPLTCALSSAEGFARGGVAVLDRLGVVEKLCFGSESGRLPAILSAAAALCGEGYDEALRRRLKSGRSFAVCRQEAVCELIGEDAAVLSNPNDNLGVEYCKALLLRGSAVEPLAFRRTGSVHDETPDLENPSAAAVRRLILQGEAWTRCVPEEAAAVFAGAVRHTMTAGERAVLARLRTLPDEAFDALPGAAEGLSNRFRRACREEASTEAILTAAKTRRYAMARLRRMLLCACLGLTAEDLQKEPPYVRVLAFDERGRALLRQIRDAGTIPLIHAGETPPDAAYYAMERRAAALYALFSEGAVRNQSEARARVYYRRA